MATEAQVHANRSNAQKSTGPRTPEGKTVVSQNAVKHGLSGRVDVIQGEDQAEFDRHCETFLAELVPVGAVETMLVERVVSLSWRLKRVERMQNEVFDALLADESTPLAKLARSLVPGKKEDDGRLTFGRAVIEDFSHSQVLDRLLMYERRMEHSLHRTLDDLKKLRVMGYISRHMDEIGTEPAGSEPAGASLRGASVPARLESVGRGRPTHSTVAQGRLYEETPYGVPTDASGSATVAEQSCKTNPICPEPEESQLPYDTGVMASLEGNGHEETKPIWTGAGAEVDVAAGAVGAPLGDTAGR